MFSPWDQGVPIIHKVPIQDLLLGGGGDLLASNAESLQSCCGGSMQAVNDIVNTGMVNEEHRW